MDFVGIKIIGAVGVAGSKGLAAPTGHQVTDTIPIAPVDWSGWKDKRPRTYRPDPDTRMDASIRLVEKQRYILEAIYDRIAFVEVRKRARRVQDRSTFRRTVEMLIANIVWAHHVRFSSTICYYRAKDKKYQAEWLTPENLLNAIGVLQTAGLIVTQIGVWKGDCSTFDATRELHKVLSEHGLDERHLEQDPQAVVLVRMKDDDKDPVTLDENEPEVISICEPLERFNEFLAGHELALNCSPEELDGLCGSMKDRAFRKSLKLPLRPELYRKTLYRSFLQRRWDRGGRLWGGWWQTIPSDWRPRITIDGEETTELDYSGFSVRLMYHEMGIPYEGDPYIIDQLGKAASPLFYRDVIKEIAQALINSDQNTKRPESITISKKLPKGMTRRNIREWIEEKHSTIAHKFHQGYGISIMFVESLITSKIIEVGLQDGIVVLPIHDSFVVQRKNETWLRDSMIKVYADIVGSIPLVH